MDISAVLQRIDARTKALGMTARAVSLHAGMSADGIRNWKRRAEQGDTGAGISTSSLAKVAEALNVSQAWLLTGADEGSTGFADEAAQFTFRPADESDPIRALYLKSARNPAITHRANAPMPQFAIWPGDLLVCDLSRAPVSGEIVIATVADDQAGTQSTVVRRYLPPYLLTGDSGPSANFLRIDQDGVTVRFAVIGAIRGTA